jgi:hypothetical protein
MRGAPGCRPCAARRQNLHFIARRAARINIYVRRRIPAPSYGAFVVENYTGHIHYPARERDLLHGPRQPKVAPPKVSANLQIPRFLRSSFEH